MIADSIEILDNLLTRKKIDLENLETLYDRKTKRFKELKRRMEHVSSAKTFLEKLSSEKEQAFTQKIQEIVQYGLDSIFGKDRYHFAVVIETLGGKKAMEVGFIENGEFTEIVDSHGGSVVEIVGYLLQVTLIMISGIRRFIFSDEQFASIRSENLLPFCELVGLLSEKLGMQMVLISHLPEISEMFSTRYYLSPSPDGVQIT